MRLQNKPCTIFVEAIFKFQKIKEPCNGMKKIDQKKWRGIGATWMSRCRLTRSDYISPDSMIFFPSSVLWFQGEGTVFPTICWVHYIGFWCKTLRVCCNCFSWLSKFDSRKCQWSLSNYVFHTHKSSLAGLHWQRDVSHCPAQMKKHDLISLQGKSSLQTTRLF